jgi:hypothetical protein
MTASLRINIKPVQGFEEREKEQKTKDQNRMKNSSPL